MLGYKLTSGLTQLFNSRLLNFTLQNALSTLNRNVVRHHSLDSQCKIITQPVKNLVDSHKNYCTKTALEPKTFSSEDLPIEKINHQLQNYEHGRLFAIVHLAGKQFRVVEGDIIIVEGYWPPDIGDKISLDKVLLVAGSDFSLIGRPLVQKGLVKVIATVIEKTLSHTRTHFRKKRRKQYMRINFFRCQHTMLRINSIEIDGSVNANNKQDTREVIIY